MDLPTSSNGPLIVCRHSADDGHLERAIRVDDLSHLLRYSWPIHFPRLQNVMPYLASVVL